MPVLAPGNGKTKTGRLWTYVRDDRPAGSRLRRQPGSLTRPTARGEHPQQHLAKFRGILQADAFAGFDKLYKDGTIQEAPCMAHIRRKFYDLVEAHQSPIAIEAVERIAALYAIEKEIRGRPPEVRQKVRSEKARPLLDAMHTWLEESLAKLSPKSVTAAAIHYALELWMQWCVIATMAASRSITTPPRERCVLSLLADGIISLRAPTRRRARCRNLFTRRIGQAERHGPGSIPALCAGAHRGSSHQAYRGVTAVERRSKPVSRKPRRERNRTPPQGAPSIPRHRGVDLSARSPSVMLDRSAASPPPTLKIAA